MEFLSNPETWVAIAFVIFVMLAATPISRAITGGLDSRAAKIKAQLDEARALRDEAERLLAEHQRKQIAAVKEAEAILAHAREEAERVQRETAANLEAAFGRREKMAIDKIAQAEAQAVADVRNQAVAVAIAAAGKLLRENIDAGKADALIEASIRELDRKLH
ncbi:MAG: F0F1 ATP synthase subunit B [Dongiaceae bacterium]